MPIDSLNYLSVSNPIQYINLIDNKNNNYEYPIANFVKLFISILKSNRFLYFSLM